MLYFNTPARPTIAATTVAEARTAGPSSLFVAGMLLRIQGTNFYDFDPTSLAADNGTTILKPDDIDPGDPGRWVSAASGAQGAQGGSGVQGAQGSTGVQGAQGTPGGGGGGAQGAQGSQGDAGAQGFQGDAGAQGSQGDAGAQGSQGDPGPLVGPIQYVFWVGTLATPPVTETGEASAPFSTLNAALAASALLPDFSAITYILTAVDYTGESNHSVSGDKFHRFMSTLSSSICKKFNVDTGASGVSVEFYNISSALGVAVTGSGTCNLIAVATNPFNGFGNIDMSTVSAPTTTSLLEFTVNGINMPSGVLKMKGGNADGNIVLSNYLCIEGVAFGVTNFTVANAPIEQGFVGCTFLGISAFDGPANSFRADDLSAMQFLTNGGSFTSGASLFTIENNTSCANYAQARGLGAVATIVASQTEASGFFEPFGAEVPEGSAQASRTEIRGLTVGVDPGESVGLGCGPTAGDQIRVENSFVCQVSVRGVASRMALGAATRQCATFHLEFMASADSAGTVTLSALLEGTTTAPVVTQGAGFVGSTLVASTGAANEIEFAFTIDGDLTVKSRIVCKVEITEVVGN